MNIKNLTLGGLGGALGGVVFGMMMGVMGMLPMIGQMIGQPTAGAGFVVHMINSALIGAGFALVLGALVNGVRRALMTGLLYGMVWWVLGPLTLMPLFMGMGIGANWNVQAAQTMLPSLMGHLVYGAILGVSYQWLRNRQEGFATATA